MKVTTVSFDLIAWAERMGALMGCHDQHGHPCALPQVKAARLLGMSLPGYKAAERRNDEREGRPCNKTLKLLAERLEAEAASSPSISSESSTT